MASKIKPQYRCWIGGNIISTLEIFKKMWVTKNDWNETGNEIVHNNILYIYIGLIYYNIFYNNKKLKLYNIL